MTNLKKKLRILYGSAAFLFLAGCGPDSLPVDPSQGDLENDRLKITNNEVTLSSYVTYYDTDIPIDTTGLPKGRLGKRLAAFNLKLRAEVSPPSSGGNILQATHVALRGDYAYVSYNTRGNVYLGGIDAFNVSNKNNPVLISRAIFQNTDVSAVYYDNNKIYLAEATDDTAFAYPAVIEEITLNNKRLTLTSRRKGVSSYVATDVLVASGKVFATSGSGGTGTGGLTVLDLATFNVLSSDLFLDARSVDIYGTVVTLLQGTPARLRQYNSSSNAFIKSVTVGGANIAESKSTVRVFLTRAFIAAGDSGTRVINLTTDAVVDSIPRPIVAGLDPSLTVTNAVSVNQDLVFMANGEAGLYVAQAPFNLEQTGTGNTNLQLLGKMQFGSQQSANFVASAGDIIFIAGGLGGLKIVKVN